MRIQFFAQTTMDSPWIEVRHNDHILARKAASAKEPARGWHRFDLDLTRHRSIEFQLYEEGPGGDSWERFVRQIVLPPGGELPPRIWFLEGTDRILRTDPFARRVDKVRIHLITQHAFRQGKAYVWTPGKEGRFHEAGGTGRYGPFFDLDLGGETGHAFNFKFVDHHGRFEEDYANRTWSSADGKEIWTHSNAAPVTGIEPVPSRLTVHLRHNWKEGDFVRMHIWQGGQGTSAGSDYASDVQGVPGSEQGWTTFVHDTLFNRLPYGFMFYCTGEQGEVWEHEQARRFLALSGDEEHYTLEGDSYLFSEMPVPDRRVEVQIAHSDPACGLDHPDRIEAMVNQSRSGLFLDAVPGEDGSWSFFVFPEVVNRFRFWSEGRHEPFFRRFRVSLGVPEADQTETLKAVLGRQPLLSSAPDPDMFQDPPYPITRQGVVKEEGYFRFAFHAPWCSRVRLVGEWIGEENGTIDMHSTMDGSLWWAQIPVETVQSGLPDTRAGDFHGTKYQYLLNDLFVDPANTELNGGKAVQDTAAEWVDTPSPSGWSRLVDHTRYSWRSEDWQRPGWESLIVYELHPDRFTRRNTAEGSPLPPFLQIAREIENPDGYLRRLGVTALLLMPVCENGRENSWGYDPSYFYAVENSYGGPDALKRLVDVCHQNGMAVLVDVVFNHVGIEHNVLWENTGETFLDGDTRWGRLPNFDHPQCRDFFEQNLIFFLQQYRIDGFRFDHTKTIIESHDQKYFSIRIPGSGGGWSFLQGVRQVVKNRDSQCLLMAEQLPNDWALTREHGPMDTQWSEHFHHRLVEAVQGNTQSLRAFAQALRYGHTLPQRWFEVTNYSESHDEVGNVNNRIAHLGGSGRGNRLAKAAAAATLLSRGIPMLFMGQESAETRQFFYGTNDALDLDRYEADEEQSRVRRWWQEIIGFRLNNPVVEGDSPLRVFFLDCLVLGFSRGEQNELVVLINFGDQEKRQTTQDFSLPSGTYQERLNSTSSEFAVETEDTASSPAPPSPVGSEDVITLPPLCAILLERTRA